MNDAIKPHLYLIACNTIWGITYPIYNYMLPKYIAIEAMLTLALISAAVMSLGTMLFDKWRPERSVDKRDIPMLIVAGVLVALLRKFFLMAGLSMTSPIDGSVISALGPVVVLILSIIVAQDRLSFSKAMGMGLGLVGTMILIFSNGSHTKASNMLLGNMLVMLGVFCTSIYIVWFKRLITKYPIMTLLRWVYCSAAIIAMPIGLRSVWAVDFSGFNLKLWLLFIFMATAPTLIANALLMSGLKRVTPAVSSIYMYLQPIFATIVTLSFGIGTLNWSKAIAAVIVLLGVLFVASSYRQKNHIVTHRIDG